MSLQKFFAAQLRKPSGWFGSLVTARMLNRHNLKIIDTTLELLNLRPNHHVLEIGFGGGISLHRLSSFLRQGMITGIDLSPEMVRKAEKHFSGEIKTGRVRVQLGDVSKLPYAASSFDRVFTVNTIYFWPDIAQGLSEIRRVLKEGGMVAISIRSRHVMQRLSFTKHNFQLFTAEEVSTLLRQAGYQDVRIDHRDQDKTVDQAVILGAK